MDGSLVLMMMIAAGIAAASIYRAYVRNRDLRQRRDRWLSGDGR